MRLGQGAMAPGSVPEPLLERMAWFLVQHLPREDYRLQPPQRAERCWAHFPHLDPITAAVLRRRATCLAEHPLQE